MSTSRLLLALGILCWAAPSRAAAPAAPLPRLSLADAIVEGLAHNAAAIDADLALTAAGAQRTLARAGLLPEASAHVTGIRQQINLAAYGIPVMPGESPVVGPFNVVDGRVGLTQSLFDLPAIYTATAGARAYDAAQRGRAAAREVVATLCARLWVEAAVGRARIAASHKQLDVAEALVRRAEALQAAGTAAGIDLLRARVQEKTQRQRVIAAENDYAKARLTLAQAIGRPLDVAFEPAQEAAYAPLPPTSLEAALDAARRARPDVLRLDALVEAQRAVRGASSAQWWPRLRLSADIGKIGNDAPTAERTFTAAVGLGIPLYEGGRIGAAVKQDDATLRRLRTARDELASRVELDVRTALLDVQAADERVSVAQSALGLAAEQLAQAQDRFAAGVASNLEVVQAQEAVATADDNHLNAILAHDLAKLAFARAQGAAQELAVRYLGGTP